MFPSKYKHVKNRFEPKKAIKAAGPLMVKDGFKWISRGYRGHGWLATYLCLRVDGY